MDPMPSCSPAWVPESEVASVEYTGSVYSHLPRNRASSFFCEVIPKWAPLFQATTLGYSRDSAGGEGQKTEDVFQGLSFQGLPKDV